jgi:hypothetical protein
VALSIAKKPVKGWVWFDDALERHSSNLVALETSSSLDRWSFDARQIAIDLKPLIDRKLRTNQDLRVSAAAKCGCRSQ